MWSFYGQAAKRSFPLLWEAVKRSVRVVSFLATLVMVLGLGTLLYFFPWWATIVGFAVLVALLFVYGLMRAVYERFQMEGQKRKQVEAEKARVEAEKARLEKKLAIARKRKAMRNLLGNVLREGRNLSQGRWYYPQEGVDDPTAEERYQEEIRKWVDDTYDLIEAAFGTFEAQHFIGNEDYADEELLGRKPQPGLWRPRFLNSAYYLKPRLKRLREIRPQMHSLEIDPDFDPQEWTK